MASGALRDVQWLREKRVAPVMNQMVMHLIAERPANDVAILASLIQYLSALNDAIGTAPATTCAPTNANTTASTTAAGKPRRAKAQPSAGAASDVSTTESEKPTEAADAFAAADANSKDDDDDAPFPEEDLDNPPPVTRNPQPMDLAVTVVQAAVKLQSLARGRAARKRTANMRQPQSSA
jgi:hypothetical protein